MQDLQSYTEWLKSKGLTTSEIIVALSVHQYGVTFTKAIYDFNEQYDNQTIDGFPDSSIEILKKYYGLKLDKMKPKTIFDKVYIMQRTLLEEPNIDAINESVEFYLGI